MSRATIHVSIDEELLDRIEKLVDDGQLSKSEIVRRTLLYGIKPMEEAIMRFVTGEKKGQTNDSYLTRKENNK